MNLAPKSERLIFRRWTPEDVNAAFALYGDPEVQRYIGNRTVATKSEMAAMLERWQGLWDLTAAGQGGWAVLLEGTIVGTALLKPLPDRLRNPTTDIEIGWHVLRSHWGQGIGTAIGSALLEYGFGPLELDILHAVVEPPNSASIRIAEKIGLTHVGQTTEYYEGIELEHFLRRRSDANRRF